MTAGGCSDYLQREHDESGGNARQAQPLDDAQQTARTWSQALAGGHLHGRAA